MGAIFFGFRELNPIPIELFPKPLGATKMFGLLGIRFKENNLFCIPFMFVNSISLMFINS